MKPLQILAFTGLAALTFTAEAAPSEIQKLLTDAQSAYLRGEMETAKSHFEMVHKIDPRNQVAIGYLRTIKAKEATRSKGADQEKQLAALIVPRVEFREATLGAALDYLKKTADRQSEGKVAVNFVVQLPDAQVKTQTVTLNLTNVPFTEVLRYFGDLTGSTIEYDKYAILVKPRAGGASGETAPVTK